MKPKPIPSTPEEERQYADFRHRLDQFMWTLIAVSLLFGALALTYGCQPAHP